MLRQIANQQASDWLSLIARGAATALGVGLTLMVLVAMTASLAMAQSATGLPATAGWDWIWWPVTGALLLIIAAFGARALTLAHGLVEQSARR